MSSRTCLAIVLAAGQGTRMRSDMPKVLHAIGHEPLIVHVLRTAGTASNASALVVGPEMEGVADVARATAPDLSVHVQQDRLGTAHAVLAAREAMLRGYDDVLVLYGDTPLLRPETLQALRARLAEGVDVAVLGFDAVDPTGYGRLVTQGERLVAIREEVEASPEEKRIALCNSGVMGFRGDLLPELLERIGKDNPKGEYFLTDAVALAHEAGRRVEVVTGDETEFLGVNTRAQLSVAEGEFQRRARLAAMAAGVTLTAPETVFFSADTRIGRDTVVEPNVVFGPGVAIGEGCTVKAFSHLEGATLGSDVTVGPFARLRPGTTLSDKARIGNFVETKNAEIGRGAKVNHLTYVGDASIGAGANIGAGTITCNYDGAHKHRTEIGAGAFVGSNSALVAPVRIGEGAYIGSGSVITRDVPDGALALGRGRQVEKLGWAEQHAPKKTHSRNEK
jgi:bifunctional UDP-N-acetylglucosamine pyrophosphorylase/glucosamine-1-phosphate N-acetyltransferase